MNIWNTVIIDPITNALIFFYNLFGDMGLAIIAITLVIRILLVPLASKAFRAQRRLQALQPELKKLQEKHKDDREALARELMAFYKREGVNPASSFLPVLLQLPILIALFFVFRDVGDASHHFNNLYSFIHRPEVIKTTFLGLMDLSQHDHLVLPLLTALLQFAQSRMMLARQPDAPAISRQITYIFPILTFVVAGNFPAAVPLYYASSTLFTLIQQYIIMREMPLAQAKAEAVSDWNEVNPEDAIAPKAVKGKIKPPAKTAVPKAVKKGGAVVTVRKRGDS
jgi:YidC/Oxa1 family membrane protein insertase